MTSKATKQSTFKSYVDLKSDVTKAAEDVFDKTSEPKLLSGEIVIAKAHNVLKYNSYGDLKHGISGALFCTNFKISFVTAERSSYDLMEIGQRNLLVSENDIPLTAVDALYQVSSSRKTKLLSPGSSVSGPVKMIEIHCKDFRVYTFSFKFSPRGEDKSVVNTILHHAFPTQLPLLFAFSFNPSNHVISNNAHGPGITITRDKTVHQRQFRDVKDWDNEIARLNAKKLRVTLVNQDFKISDSLPEYFVVPSCLTDNEINNAANHFVEGRVATWSWSHSNGASLYRMVSLRADTVHSQYERRMLQAIKSTHPRDLTSITIDLDKYCSSIGSIQSSFKKLKELCMPETTKDFLSGDNKWYCDLDTTKWLHCVRKCLSISIDAVDQITTHGKSVILRESDGRDLSCLISSLIQLMLDPSTRTLQGFESLIQKEWVVMGHPFLNRYQHVSATDGEESPVFLLFLDCVWQLTNQCPSAFGFTDTYLITLWDCSHHGLFETFIFNCERQRYRATVSDVKTPVQLISVWNWSLQFNDDDLSLFNNPLYFIRHKLHTNCPGCRDDEVRTLLQYTSTPVKRPVNADSSKTPYRKLSEANQPQWDQSPQRVRQNILADSDGNLATKINPSSPAVKFWTQCYLRWVPYVHVVNGGPPSEYLQQCMLVDEIHYLRLKLHSLRTSTPLSKKHNRDSGLYFTYDGSPKLGENFTSAFPFSPNSSTLHLSHSGDKQSLFSSIAGMFVRSPSVSSYDGIIRASGSMSSNNDEIDEAEEL
ncbi:myotubularin-related protein 10-like isoform X2 [Glandiceps talaboti]